MRPSELWAAYEEAFAARDWERVRSHYADDVVAIDHRPLGFGELRGSDAMLDYVRGFFELASGAAPRLREVLGEHTHGFAAVIEALGGPDDGPVGLDYILVAEIRDDRATRLFFFPPEHRDEALRQFEAL